MLRSKPISRALKQTSAVQAACHGCVMPFAIPFAHSPCPYPVPLLCAQYPATTPRPHTLRHSRCPRRWGGKPATATATKVQGGVGGREMSAVATAWISDLSISTTSGNRAHLITYHLPKSAWSADRAQAIDQRPAKLLHPCFLGVITGALARSTARGFYGRAYRTPR